MSMQDTPLIIEYTATFHKVKCDPILYQSICQEVQYLIFGVTQFFCVLYI